MLGSDRSRGDSCTIAVQFVPSAAGHASATLNVPSNASSGSVTAALIGAEQKVNGRWVATSTETVSARQAGPLHVTLGATVSGRTLAPGHYRVVLQASANGQTGTPVTMPLTVKPPANGPHGQPRLLSVTVNPHTITPRTHAVADLPAQPHGEIADDPAGADPRRWQQVAGATTHVSAGTDRVELVGRWRGRLVAARVVRLTITASAAGQRSVAETFYITVHHAPGWAKDMTRAFLSAP